MNKVNTLFLILLNVILSTSIILKEDQQLFSELIKGTPISSDSSSKSLSNAFDGDISTEFKSSKESNGWIGLELDNTY